jgi:hypothetical protein
VSAAAQVGAVSATTVKAKELSSSSAASGWVGRCSVVACAVACQESVTQLSGETCEALTGGSA